MLSIVTEAWPSKSVGAKFSDEPLQECHVDPSLSQGQTRWRLNYGESGEYIDWTTIGPHFQITRVQCGCGLTARPHRVHP